MRAPLRALVTGLLLTGVAGGCQVGPAYHRPGADVPASYRFGEAPGPSAAADPWWTLYRDPVLVELLRTAILENHDLKTALARVDEARELVIVTGAARYPTLDVGAGAAWTRSSRNTDYAPSDVTSSLYRVSLDMAWELDVFGGIRSQTDAAQARFFATAEAYEAVGLALVAEVARVYFELRSADAQRAITARTLESTARYVELAQIRFEGGKTGELDWRQAEAEHYRTQVKHIEAMRRIELRENQLSVLLGRKSGPILRGLEAAAQPVPPQIPTGLPSDLLSRRPDLREREEILKAETSLVGAAQANLYPRFALTGAYGFESATLGDLLAGPAQIGSIAAGLLQPVFNAGRNKALLRAQRARMQGAAESYLQALYTAFGEVEDGLVSVASLREQRGVQDRRVHSLRRVLDLAETRWVGGVAVYLEVLDAQRGLLDAELESNDTILGELTSLVALYKALGGGWILAEGANLCECGPPPLAMPPSAARATSAPQAVSSAPRATSSSAAPTARVVPTEGSAAAGPIGPAAAGGPAAPAAAAAPVPAPPIPAPPAPPARATAGAPPCGPSPDPAAAIPAPK